jgi:ribose transport system substrate-binding protein
MTLPRMRAPAIHRASEVLASVAVAGRPLSLAEITVAVQAPKSSVSSVCNALASGGLLVRGDDGTFALGPRLAELGAAAHLTRPLVRRIGVTTPATSRRFFLAEVESIRQEAESLGAEMLHRSAGDDPRQQAEHVREFLAWGADLIVVDPLAANGMADALSEAQAQGVPVVSINGVSSGADAAVTTDNPQAGVLAGQFLAQTLGYAGTVVLVDGTSATAVTDRVVGFLEALRPYRQIHVIEHLAGDNTEETARGLVAALLERGVRPDGFFGINDPTALGIADACAAVGHAPPIVGVDGSEAALNQIRSGGPIVASAAQDPYELGRMGVQLGIELRSGVQPRQSTVLLPTTLIHAGLLNGYRAWDAAS